MTNYRFEFDHEAKTVEVIEVTSGVFNMTPRKSVALYKYTVDYNKAGLELLSGSVSKEVQDFLRTSFLSWCDINRGFLWKS